MLTREAGERLIAEAEDAFTNCDAVGTDLLAEDFPVVAEDEPLPVVVTLDEALRETALDALCKSCGSRNCTGCPSNPRG